MHARVRGVNVKASQETEIAQVQVMEFFYLTNILDFKPLKGTKSSLCVWGVCVCV